MQCHFDEVKLMFVALAFGYLAGIFAAWLCWGRDVKKKPSHEDKEPFEAWLHQQWEWENWYYKMEGPAEMAVGLARKAYRAGEENA